MRTPQNPFPVGRRRVLLGAAGATALALTGCAGTTTAGGSGWQFTDDLGKRITADRRPQRVFAFVSCAAALWDFGVRPTGVFGPCRTADGEREITAGNIDLDRIQIISNSHEPFNPEKLIAQRPELVVTGLAGTEPKDRWIVQDQLARKLEPVVPIASISEYKLTLPEVIDRYAKLAGALGANVDAPEIRSAKARFEEASQELRAVLKQQQGLRVQVVYGDRSNIYIARPSFYADLAYYRELGMEFVNGAAFQGSGGGVGDYYEMLSWEEADKYPADFIMTDARPFSLTREQMAASFPTWRQLPAVRRGQLGRWIGEPRFSYQLAAPEIEQLAKDIRAAKTGIAS